jgi:hypothetical protein
LRLSTIENLRSNSAALLRSCIYRGAYPRYRKAWVPFVNPYCEGREFDREPMSHPAAPIFLDSALVWMGGVGHAYNRYPLPVLPQSHEFVAEPRRGRGRFPSGSLTMEGGSPFDPTKPPVTAEHAVPPEYHPPHPRKLEHHSTSNGQCEAITLR